MNTYLKRGIFYFLNIFYPIFRKWIPFQVYAYLAVGAANTLLNILLVAFFYELILPQKTFGFLGLELASYTIALILAFIITVPTGFWLSKHFAFVMAANNRSANQKQLLKYFLVVLQGVGSDYLILKLLIIYCGLQPTMAKFLSTIMVVTVNYLLQKYFTFRVSVKQGIPTE